MAEQNSLEVRRNPVAINARAFDLRFEHASASGSEALLGLGNPVPRLSWKVESPEGRCDLARYELEIEVDGDVRNVVVNSAEQVLVPWPVEPLRSRQRVRVRVRLGDDRSWGGWSAPATAETGLLHPDQWTSVAIGAVQKHGRLDPAPLLRKTFVAPPGINEIRLRIACLGLYAVSINGSPVTTSVLDPGWTSYHHRRRARTYDVTHLVVEGDNAIEIILGNGWYRGRLGFEGKEALYGCDLSVLAQLEIVHAEGVMVVPSTEDWTAVESHIRSDDLYDGQVTDLRPAADKPLAVVRRPFDTALVRPADDVPVRRLLAVEPVSLDWKSDGRLIVDFGQNVVGWLRLSVSVEGGATVTVRHAEVLQNQELAVEPLGTAKATDSYLLPPGFGGDLEPCFTFHGFRYAEVSGLDATSVGAVAAIVIGTDMPRTGWFECDDDQLNRLHENVLWSMRGNFVDIPTDCPQRAERLGWTADVQVFAPSALFLFDCTDLLSGWLTDLSSEQRADGSVPWTIPSVFDNDASAAGWGDAAVIVPWALYESTGDERILRDQFPSMRRWLDRVHSLLAVDGTWRGGFQFGDWLDPTAPADAPHLAATDPDLVATAYHARSVQLAAEIANVIGLSHDADRFRERAEQARAAFAATFITPRGRLTSDTVTAYAMAMTWDLLPTQDQRDVAASRLGDLVRASAFRITTGFLGTPLVLGALADSGQTALAIRLLFQTQCPSWLYPITMGATTIWERWDSMLPDGSLNSGKMTSFNHFALGAVAQWLHRSLAGLSSAAPGWRRIRICPTFTGRLNRVSAAHITPYGRAAVEYRRHEDGYRVQAVVPPGTVADLWLPPDYHPVTVGPGTHVVDVPFEVPRLGPLENPTVRDVVDDEVLWSGIVGVMADAGRGDDRVTARAARPYFDHPAAAIIAALTPFDGIPDIDAVRNQLNVLIASGVYPGRLHPPPSESARG